MLDESIEVCIKFLKPSRSPREQETQIKNFQREVGLMRCEAARAVARRLTAMHSQLRHPNIMELVTAGTEPFMFIVVVFLMRCFFFSVCHLCRAGRPNT